MIFQNFVRASAPPGPPHSSFTETEGEVSMFVVAILCVHDDEQCWSVFIDLCLTDWTFFHEDLKM